MQSFSNKQQIGSFYWDSKDGRLSTTEKKKYFKMLVKAQLKENYIKIQKSFGLIKFPSSNFDEIIIPDSALSKKAIEEVETLYSPALMKHCYRTYFWAVGTATAEKINFDNEMLFVASILHDIGLSEQHNHICTSKCFAIYGAEQVQNSLRKFDLPEEKLILLYEAIGMHLNPTIDRNTNFKESYLLSRGAVMDVIGAFHFLLNENFIEEVHKRYNREGFMNEITMTMSEFNHLKNTRAELLYRWGFAKMANKNPLDKLVY